MGRKNKVTERIFTEIVPSGMTPIYENFLDHEKENGIIDEDETLSAMKSFYKFIIDNNKKTFDDLASIEEVIIQIRAKYAIDQELRLSLSRNYIYARTTFFRRRFEINDIRVIVGKVEDYGSNLDYLMVNKEFRELAKSKLIELMDSEINNNIKQLQTIIYYEDN